tara:strand:+ start:33076 stop:33852 length:777 start_codon:yes stop_codon:yes gene_type:complete
MSTSKRFTGIEKLYGAAATEGIFSSHICVIGIGGVGSWVAESLARSGVGALTLIDLDHISESNINRQIQAMSSTLGQSKIEAMAERIAEINPDCELHLVDEHISSDNIETLIERKFSYIVDCIDDFRTKAALINYCYSKKQKILTVGGAGGRIDPSRIQLADLTRSEGDALLSRTRKLLRTDFNFSRNIKKRFDIPCVFSAEALRYPTSDAGITYKKEKSETTGGLNCAAGFGSLMAVTASFGMQASAYVLTKLADSR